MGIGNEPFYRVGVNGDFFLGKLDFYRCTCMVGITRILGTAFLPTEFFPREPKHPTFNGGFIEAIIT